MGIMSLTQYKYKSCSRTSLTTVSEFHYAELFTFPSHDPTHSPLYFFLYYLVILLHTVRPLKSSLGNSRKILSVYSRLDGAFQRHKFWCVGNLGCRTDVKALPVPWGNSQMPLSSPELTKAAPHSWLCPQVYLDIGQAHWLPSSTACRNCSQGLHKHSFFLIVWPHIYWNVNICFSISYQNLLKKGLYLVTLYLGKNIY